MTGEVPGCLVTSAGIKHLLLKWNEQKRDFGELCFYVRQQKQVEVAKIIDDDFGVMNSRPSGAMLVRGDGDVIQLRVSALHGSHYASLTHFLK